MDKRLSYSQEDLVDVYDQKRFYGRSGQFVNQKEVNTIGYFLKKTFRIIFLPLTLLVELAGSSDFSDYKASR